ncbi:hypothetical protein DXG01_007866 [Tephrocybe rancida]|nr:hypothetical protein DXG01_007866 [Tephrocybe rancida]
MQHWHRRHASTAAQKEEFQPSEHLISSRKRLPGFTGDTHAQQATTRTSKARFNMRMMEAAEQGRYADVLDIAANMKSEGIQPDLTTYSALMRAADRHRRWLDAWAILDDLLAVGLQPDITIFNYFIQAQSTCTSDYLWKALNKMEELGVMPNATTFAPAITRYIGDNNTELALQCYRAMKTYNVIPDITTTASLIGHVADVGYPRLALDLLADYEKVSVRRMDHTVWVQCLTASTEALYLEGVVLCWKMIVHELNINPGEGVCLAVLDTAARNANPDLATDALRVLKSADIKWEEHHFAPLIDAFCGQNQLKEAIQVLEIMRSQEIEPIPETVSSLLAALSDTETIDSVWVIIDEMVKEGKKIDLSVLQALISASVKLGDLQRAIGAYKSLAEYGATPDLAIFNSLIEACRSASHRDLGNLLLNDMRAANINPDEVTYEKFISLCLTQQDYEDAFFYLEEMKSAGFHPGYNVYAALVKKCLNHGDFRYRIALKEMEEKDFKPGSEIRRLRRAVESRPVGKGVVEERNDLTQRVGIDGSALRFIESGGVEGAAELPKEHA